MCLPTLKALGAHQAQQLIFVGDGAKWIWERTGPLASKLGALQDLEWVNLLENWPNQSAYCMVRFVHGRTAQQAVLLASGLRESLLSRVAVGDGVSRLPFTGGRRGATGGHRVHSSVPPTCSCSSLPFATPPVFVQRQRPTTAA